METKNVTAWEAIRTQVYGISFGGIVTVVGIFIPIRDLSMIVTGFGMGYFIRSVWVR